MTVVNPYIRNRFLRWCEQRGQAKPSPQERYVLMGRQFGTVTTPGVIAYGESVEALLADVGDYQDLYDSGRSSLNPQTVLDLGAADFAQASREIGELRTYYLADRGLSADRAIPGLSAVEP